MLQRIVYISVVIAVFYGLTEVKGEDTKYFNFNITHHDLLIAGALISNAKLYLFVSVEARSMSISLYM